MVKDLSLTRFENNLKVARIDTLFTTKKVVFGCESITKISEEVKEYNPKKIFLVTDKNLLNIGLVDSILKPLEKEKIDITLHEVVSEPSVESVSKAVEEVRKNKCDLVIGFGGGSSLDTAKTAAIMAKNNDTIEKYLARLPNPFEDKFKEKGLPLILVPTTAGTGSENSAGAVIIDGQYKTWIASRFLYPDVAIVDPLLTVSVPAKTTASCAMDALSHAVEAFMVVALSNPWCDSFALEAIKLISKYLRKAYHNGNDLEARWYLCWAAHLGGWTAQFTWGPATVGHLTAEAIGPKYGIPHGLICGIALPYAMKFNLPAIPDRLKMIAVAMGENVGELSEHEAAKKGIQSIIRLMEDVDLPLSLKEVNIPRVDLHDLAEYIVKERQYLYDIPRLSPRKFTSENIQGLLEDMWHGRYEI
uniref:Iron-containing alcohol dehydrogenase n=1 Tax=candidate division CPR3 bacterium TaxID=2268181 RepID=A0A7C5YXU6_UNCC3